MPSNLDLIFFPSSMGNATNLNHTISWLIMTNLRHSSSARKEYSINKHYVYLSIYVYIFVNIIQCVQATKQTRSYIYVTFLQAKYLLHSYSDSESY